MTEKKKIELALGACSEHEATYDQRVPARMVQFWKTGEAFRYEQKCLPEGTRIPMYEPGSFRLAVTVPSWDAQSSFGTLDDAVVGRKGD